MIEKKDWNIKKWILPAFALGSIFMAACSDGDKTADTSEESEGIVAVKDLDVAGVSQKGPFVEGSAVTVQGVDCQTMELTDEKFSGSVKSDKGDFALDNVTLSSSCALFEVTGKYRNEVTGKKSSKEITLHALTDLKDRKNVNINLLTELEYERLMYLVTEKGKTFAEAKEQAEKEVLAAFDIAGSFEEFENLNIFESGDENAALLAVSVMMQAETDDAGLAKRVDKFADSFVETGEWKDSVTKKAISEWAVEATANGGLDSIRKNVEGLGYGDTIPAFEKFIPAVIPDTVSGTLSSSSTDVDSAETSSSSSADAGSEYDATTNTLKDLRDSQTYKTVTIGNQIWMAENLNYKSEGSSCYNDDTSYCSKFGRLYSWSMAMDSVAEFSENGKGCGLNVDCIVVYPVRGVCPEGWHFPILAEWNELFDYVDPVGGYWQIRDVGRKLKSSSGWSGNGNGSDEFGFSALPGGMWYDNAGYEDPKYVDNGERALFWSGPSVGKSLNFSQGTAIILYNEHDYVYTGGEYKYYKYSVRCVKD